MDKELRWEIHAYKEEKEDHVLTDVSSVFVNAENEEGALRKAKDIIKRANYRVGKVWEREDYDPKLAQEMQMVQLKIQKEMLQHVKGHSNG